MKGENQLLVLSVSDCPTSGFPLSALGLFCRLAHFGTRSVPKATIRSRRAIRRGQVQSRTRQVLPPWPTEAGGAPEKVAEFVRTAGYDWPHVLVALDTAADRRSVQASLPKWIANSWTQPGDLGLSVHGQFDGPGACLSK